jgi:hypothetical protein
MRVEKGVLVALGYGKYFRAENIVGMEPVEEGRGPGRRTLVYVQGLSQPVVASRSEGAILRDMTDVPKEITRVQEQQQILSDILDTISDIDPVMRKIIREQSSWNLDRLEERIKDLLVTESSESE